MKTVQTKRDLRDQTSHYVLVQREAKVYVRVDQDYVAKPYFDINEASEILGANRNKMHRICRELGIQAPANKRKKLRITLEQLRRMAQMV